MGWRRKAKTSYISRSSHGPQHHPQHSGGGDLLYWLQFSWIQGSPACACVPTSDDRVWFCDQSWCEDHALLLSCNQKIAGTENFHSVDPKMIHSNPSLQKISPNKRQCYLQVNHNMVFLLKTILQVEKQLKFYHHYTFPNCMMECHANVTLTHCDCNMYFQVQQC